MTCHQRLWIVAIELGWFRVEKGFKVSFDFVSVAVVFPTQEVFQQPEQMVVGWSKVWWIGCYLARGLSDKLPLPCMAERCHVAF